MYDDLRGGASPFQAPHPVRMDPQDLPLKAPVAGEMDGGGESALSSLSLLFSSLQVAAKYSHMMYKHLHLNPIVDVCDCITD